SGPKLSTIIEMRPPTKSCSPAAAPSYGTNLSSMPDWFRKRSAVRCGSVPRALAAYRISPGRFERRRNRDYHRRLSDKSDPNKITIKIERQIWKHVRHDDEGRRSWHVEGVTVRSGRCRLAGCNAAARSGMVEYDHLLPPQPAEVLGHDARDHV